MGFISSPREDIKEAFGPHVSQCIPFRVNAVEEGKNAVFAVDLLPLF